MNEIVAYNERFVSVVENIVGFNKLSHAYIIEVNDYDEDYNVVKDFIKLILCREKVQKFDKLNCDKCEICRLVDSNNHPDFFVIEPEGKEIRKKQLLELQKEYNNTSVLNSMRVYVIKEADKLNIAAANSMLKFIEEPEDNIVAILLTRNRYKIIETILSRCQILALRKKKVLDDNSNNMALSFIKYMLKPGELFINYKEIIDNIMPDKIIAEKVLNDVKLILINYLEKNDSLIDLSKIEDKKIINWILILEKEEKKLDYNVNFKLWLDALFVRLIGGDSNV